MAAHLTLWGDAQGDQGDPAVLTAAPGGRARLGAGHRVTSSDPAGNVVAGGPASPCVAVRIPQLDVLSRILQRGGICLTVSVHLAQVMVVLEPVGTAKGSQRAAGRPGLGALGKGGNKAKGRAGCSGAAVPGHWGRRLTLPRATFGGLWETSFPSFRGQRLISMTLDRKATGVAVGWKEIWTE